MTAHDPAEPDRLNAQTVGIALLLAVPPGVGMAVGVGLMTGRGPTDPLVIAAGTGLAVVLFAFIVVASLMGSTSLDA